MKKEEAVPNYCSKFKKIMSEENLCDYYSPKRKGKYKTRCKNCIHFQHEKVDEISIISK